MADENDNAELDQYLGDLSFKVRRELATAIKAEADRLADAIRAAAPVKTGALRDSVKVRRTRNDLTLYVDAGGDATTKEVRQGSGVSYDYALATEYGTSKEHAQPFFYPTVRAMEDDIDANIAAAVEKALNE
jgi:HK97 gp10 family phage protein